MQELLANVDVHKFDIEIALEQQLGSQPLPFPGMDKSGMAICTFFLKSVCSKGQACPFRHVKGDRSIVCKHWLRGLCKKGDNCEFLHEYDMSKMPECYFFSKFGLCSNKECPFLHIDPEKKMKDCPWYDRGFCRHGPMCKNRHVRRVICQNYLCGFCLDGPQCKFMHPKFDIPGPDLTQHTRKLHITCHFCGEAGHKAISCVKLQSGQIVAPPVHVMQQNIVTSENLYSEAKEERSMRSFDRPPHQRFTGEIQRRPLDEVTCYKCGEKGHYANKCPKGHLAFLSLAAHPDHNDLE